MPNFDHQFDPPNGSTVGAVASLSTREIEDAGLHEVLQTPGAALGTWSLFNALIDATTPDFRFYEPLGRSREVKTALSGLFGRFVARAYATKYLGYLFFSSIHSPPMSLIHGNGQVERLQGGDLPDWAVWAPSVGLGIVEAKGSHDWPGPAKALERAYTQAGRVTIKRGGRTANFKRYAIATRWGFMTNGPDRPMLWVKDPDEAGDGLSEKSLHDLGMGIARRHYASLLTSLNHPELANNLLALTQAQSEAEFNLAQGVAMATLAVTPVRELRSGSGPEPDDDLVGGFVTRAGPLDVSDLSITDREVLQRLGMRPAFVGAERIILENVISGDHDALLQMAVFRRLQTPSETERVPRTNGTGTWIFRPDEDDGYLG